LGGRDNEIVKTFVRADFAHAMVFVKGPRATRLVPVLLCGGREHGVVPLAVPVVSRIGTAANSRSETLTPSG
jgi:hypothetical protein